MEVFGVVSSAVQLADVTFRLFNSLGAFIQNAKTADIVARELRSKVEALWNTVRCVVAVLQARDTCVHERPFSQEEQHVRRKLHKDLEVCHRILEEFGSSLQALLDKPTHPSWLGKSLLQLQLQQRHGPIIRFESFLDSRLQMLQVSLACLQVLLNITNHKEVVDSLEYLSTQISRGRTELGRVDVKSGADDTEADPYTTQSELPRIEISDLDRVDLLIQQDQKCFREDYNELIVEASKVHASTAGSVRAATEITSEAPGVPKYEEYLSPYTRPSSTVPPSQVSFHPYEEPCDPTPDFDDTTHLEPLEKLIERFTSQAESDLADDLSRRAEGSQREAMKLLEERCNGYDLPYHNYDEMQSRLADILAGQQKYDEADKIRWAILQGHDTFTPANSRRANVEQEPDAIRSLKAALQYHSLAKTNHERYTHSTEQGLLADSFLSVAERDAKRAFKCRRQHLSTSDPAFLSTVELLVQIYKDQLKPIYADVYSKTYLDQDEQPAGSESGTAQAILSRIASIDSPPPPRRSTQFDVRSVASGDRSQADSMMDCSLQPSYTNRSDPPIDLKLLQDPQAARMHVKRLIQANDQRGLTSFLETLGPSISLVNYALLEASRAGNVSASALLLRHDAQPNSMSDLHESPLHIASEHGHLSIVQLLLDARADPHIRGADAWTPLHFAVHGDRRGVVHTLLHHSSSSRAAVDAQCVLGNTALHLAAEQGNFDLGDILIRGGAGTHVRNADGATPLEVAVDARHIPFANAWLSQGGLEKEVRAEKIGGAGAHVVQVLKRAGMIILESERSPGVVGQRGRRAESFGSAGSSAPSAASGRRSLAGLGRLISRR